jgi:phosphatidylglycerol:prolipoprotein diacylglycerol transferase
MPISFPGLFGEWSWNPDPIAIHIGHGIYWYGIILAFAMLCGAWLSMKRAKRAGITEDHVLDFVLWATPCCILGSRTYYVLFNQSLYRNAEGGFDWGRAVAVWDGGIAIYGTVIAGLLVAYFFARSRFIPFGALMDTLVYGLMLGQVIGRWANFVNREAFGGETSLPWRMRLWFEGAAEPVAVDVHPTFFYESLWNLIGLILLCAVISRGRRFDGENAWFYFLWYGLGRAWIEGLRTDSLYLFDWEFFGAPVRVSQALSLCLAGVAAVMLWFELKVVKRSPKDLYVYQPASRQWFEDDPNFVEPAPPPDDGGNASGGNEMAILMDGKALAEKTRAKVKKQVGELRRPPCLAVILVGNDPASEVYVRNKEKDCAECGIHTLPCKLPASITQDQLLTLIQRLNNDAAVDGILCQLPLPPHLDASEVLRAIHPEKDVDCFHPYNVGQLSLGDPGFLPCTPAGIMMLLLEYGIPIRGRHCVIIGRSNIVGKPLAMLLTAADGTVTLCHSRTERLPMITRQADILIVAAGKRNLVTADMVKAGATVIDVGMNRDENGKLCGDVDFDNVAGKAGWITPVPGGVGPMTRARLLENVLTAAKRKLGED